MGSLLAAVRLQPTAFAWICSRRASKYDVGTLLGGYLVAEGWAEIVQNPESAVAVPLSEFGPDCRPTDGPAKLRREFFPPYYDGPPEIALDRRRRPRPHVKL